MKLLRENNPAGFCTNIAVLNEIEVQPLRSPYNQSGDVAILLKHWLVGHSCKCNIAVRRFKDLSEFD